ncbi:elongation factor G [Streptomyces profundus]|uniref:elongation factor G n=1 Tax=Streptomyces profundus TaxID=2867410 RepID=UPI001D16F8F3|nr:TetM/TetW/TetO/TetS family tetracycline resistance ribosomal protection protein [Streptomyces sp. MA3_2.13]UED87313.1 TetM/TetW/TetO/TetS family tetracycline resistance ribosomal protection protein [Streptomyces sp. MA3_2.13]
MPSHPQPNSSRNSLPSTLNIGVLAHIDAGKTSLTERLLFDNGAIPELGSVDAGSTRTDTGALERERGITIRSAVATFTTGDLQVNLVDTPGHPDFIAEVERALSVLDAAVLVLSAVEGVQAQTRVLMRSLRRLGLPTLLFLNKIDRPGARPESLLGEVRARLAPHLVPLTTVTDPGTPGAGALPRPLDAPEVRAEVAAVLAEQDEALLGQLVDERPPSARALGRALVEQTAAGLVHPVLCGSALTGAGSAQLVEALRTLLRPPAADPHAAPSGTVFAIERTGAGEKAAYLRLFDGQLAARRLVTFHRREPDGGVGEFTGRISRVEVVGAEGEAGAPAGRRLRAGGIARLYGLPRVRIGDRLGRPPRESTGTHFAPPSLETVVRPADPERKTALHAALTALADEDPLIRTRSDADGSTSVLLYGAVQREVIAERLARDFGLRAVFEPVTPVYFERPNGVGEAAQELNSRAHNDFWATVGLRVEPTAPGSGVRFHHRAERGVMPAAFHRAIEESVLRTLRQGLAGWEVTDCAVTLFLAGQHAPASTAADFRGLTPIVLLRALQAAGTTVFEPCLTLEIEIPPDTLSAVTGLLTGHAGRILDSAEAGDVWALTVEVPSRLVPRITTALPGLTRGEAAHGARPGGDRPVRNAPPTRARRDGDPLDHDVYLRFLAQRHLAVDE